jgi:nucleoside-diphosphate-sugar epimerase
MNVGILGCGYVGTAVARRWHQDHSYYITATTTTEERVSDLDPVAQKVVVIKGDNETALKSVVQEQELILLSVAPTSPLGANSYEETYLHTAKNLVKALQQGTTVKQLIYTGSYSVYGNKHGSWVDEETPLTPANRNGEILAQTEQVLMAASSPDLKVCILRLGGIYGIGRELTKIFSRVFGTTRPGNGEDFTNWIHLDDIVGAVDFAAVEKLQGIYNLVGERPQLSRDLLLRLSEKYDLPKVMWNPSEGEVHPYNARVSNQKIKAAGYKFIHPEIML